MTLFAITLGGNLFTVMQAYLCHYGINMQNYINQAIGKPTLKEPCFSKTHFCGSFLFWYKDFVQ